MKTFWEQVRLIIGNDLRLQQRSSRAGAFMKWGLVLGLGVLLHFIMIAVYASYREAAPLPVEALVWWFLALFMLGAAMTTAIGSLYERADFDLLLSSPASVRAILLARLGSMAAAAFLSVIIFIPALIDPAVFFLSPAYLAGYVVWILLAGAAAGVGTSFTLGLVHVLGARRARTVSQVIAAVLAASACLVGQLPNLLLHTVGESRLLRLYSQIERWPAFLIPAQAGRGSFRAMAILAIFAIAALGLTIQLMARTFVSGLQDIAAEPARAPRSQSHSWNERLALATFWKDFRLIARDPLLLAQILPQTLVILPIGISALRWIGVGALAPMVFMMAFMLSAALTAVAMAGEECWDLIRMSPSPELRLRNSKMAAGMAVPVLIVTVVSLVLAGVGRPGLGILTFFVSFAVSASVSRLAASAVTLAPRRDIMRRNRLASGSVTRNAGDQVVASLYFMVTGAGGLACVAQGSGWARAAGAGLIVLAFIGAATCFAFVKLKPIVWREDEVRP